ncbi:MAG TPA: hypothetical protein VFP97_00965 [Chitinophagaceae bacterium]|nr:hypothetical protein [Chitinophagaceae bacterium]
MKLKYLFILLLGWFHASSQKNTSIIFQERMIDSIDKKIDSILLIGIGSTTTRIFLDDLSRSIIKGLNDDGIVADYQYLGKTTVDAQSTFDTINKKGYKGILFFLPTGDSFFDVQGDLTRINSNTRVGSITPVIGSSKIDYEQDFNIQLCIPNLKMKKVWTASLEVSGDLSKSKNANKVAAKLLSYFKKNNYIK